MKLADEDKKLLTRLFGEEMAAEFAADQPFLRKALHVDGVSPPADMVSTLISCVLDRGLGGVAGGWSWTVADARGELAVYTIDAFNYLRGLRVA